MRRRLFLSLLFAPLVLVGPASRAEDPPPAKPVLRIAHAQLAPLGWQFVPPTSVFPGVPLLDLIDKLHAQTVHNIEVTTGQPVAAGGGAVLSPLLPDDAVASLVARLKADHLGVAGYAFPALDAPPADFSKDEPATRRVFEFVRRLGARSLVTPMPSPASVEMLGRLADEYNVRVVLVPARGQSAEGVLAAAAAGRSERLGVALDTAAVKRSGADPVAWLRALKGRIFQVRLGDVDAAGNEVPLGRGTLDCPALLAELKAQGFRGQILPTYSRDSADGDLLTGGWGASANAFNDMVVPFWTPADAAAAKRKETK